MSSIWKTPIDLERLNAPSPTINSLLDIRIEAAGDDWLSASMPVDERTHQPYGILHGGASVVLAETVGSIASYQCIDTSRYYCVGLDINANHLRAVRQYSVGVRRGCGVVRYPRCVRAFDASEASYARSRR